jgi:tRNA dimethylallyltransferase
MNDSAAPKLLVLVGPTGSGKTEIAIQLAQALSGEIISADSRYLYRELNIGTAKPNPDELTSVPHHLINVTTLENPWSLGVYQKATHYLIQQINIRGHLPILTGGTGQYVRAITEQWEIPAQAPGYQLRDAIMQWGEHIGFDALHHRLARLDPEAALLIDYRNKRRTIRALEVIFTTGQRFSDLRKKSVSPYRQLIVGIAWPRELLYERIDARIEAMVAAGLIEEVQDLVDRGYAEALKRMGIIGYSEVLQYLEGQSSLEEAIQQIRHNTRIFVRRQANWFKSNDPKIHWFNATDPDMLAHMLDLINVTF